MEYFVPTHMKGRAPNGAPYELFMGIHNVSDALANSREANRLGIIPVEEMADSDWTRIGVDKAKWMEANRPKAKTEDIVAKDPDASSDDVTKSVAQSRIAASVAAKPVDGATVAPAVTSGATDAPKAS